MLDQGLSSSTTVGPLLDLAFLITSWAHVLLAPYTKVEESFNLHATHDVLAYGLAPSALPFYDHFVFPGVVPRTFIGSNVLAGSSYLPLRVATSLGLIQSKLDIQILIRLVLATINVYGLSLIHRAVRRRFSTQAAFWFVILTCTQFHLPFWIGRTLPNMFALLPVNMAISLLVFPGSTNITIKRHYRAALCLVGSAAIIYRSELILLALPIFVGVVYRQKAPLSFLIPYGASVALGSTASTILVDSYFWNQRNPPLWPELSGILFNVYEGKSSEWGSTGIMFFWRSVTHAVMAARITHHPALQTSPFHAYLTHHLPKLLLASLPLAIFACVPLSLKSISNSDDPKDTSSDDPKGTATGWRLDAANTRSVRALLAPFLAFVLLVSGLGHKEWRFVVYVVPMVNVAAAVGAQRLTTLQNKHLRVLGRLALVGLIACNIIATTFLTIVSRANYPGGAALALVNSLPQSTSLNSTVSVHIDNLAAQTGASLFTQEHSPPVWTHQQDNTRWTYSKDPSPTSFSSYTYLVTEHTNIPDGEWDIVGSIDALDRVDIRRGLNALVTKPTLFILRNRHI
ncbi:glycosyltransferase family 22 protein [Ceratobasidium sp. AG-Ba]|nr:glycosyltransferase family 22 protein [Ceratobasidium sp. AG-Ba]